MGSLVISPEEPVHFEINGLLSDFALSTLLDGYRETGNARRILGMSISQQVDGTSGTTTLELVKISTGGAITSVMTLSLAQGGGANARATSTTIATELLRTLAANERLAVRLTAVQVAGQNLSASVFFGYT